MSMELTVQAPETMPVSWNKAEMAAAVLEIASRYAGLVVTDKAAAKADRAEVNRMLKQVDDVRKEVKRRYEAPLKAFEAELKEIVEPLRAAGAAIDEQIKAIEATEREERRQALVTAYEAAGTHNVPFERIFDPAWLNASTGETKALKALQAAVDAAEADIAAIKAQKSPYEAALIDKYNSGATLAEVLAYAARLDAQAPVEAVAAAMPEENPLNVYTLTDNGVVVTAKQNTYNIMVTCSSARFDQITQFLDNLGVFFITD